MNRADEPLVIAGAMVPAFIINPWAAIGAAAGCCFFLAMPSATDTLRQRFLLAVFSWVMGYGSGAYLYPGPPWSQEAMLVSGAAAALSSVAFTGIHSALHNGRDLPPWLLSIVEIVRGRK